MTMSFSLERMPPSSVRNCAIWPDLTKALLRNSWLMSWMRNMPNIPAPPSRLSNTITTPMAPSMRVRMVKPRIISNRLMNPSPL